MRKLLSCLLVLFPTVINGSFHYILPNDIYYNHSYSYFEEKDSFRIWKSIYELSENPVKASELTPIFLKVSRIYNIDPLYLVSMSYQESSFRYNVVGSKGEIGLFQIRPFWTKELNMKREDLFDPYKNTYLAGYILRKYLDKHNGDYAKAIRDYNHRIYGHRYAKKVMRRYNLIAKL